ncbi:hypothetical protein, partial [Brevundimonas sp.]|uniref:hypothetical protein n=1 Tax=Brevundimonas sp. TaxID=1871086 RepID=UPI0035633B82
LWAPSVSSDLKNQGDGAAYWAAYGGLRGLLRSPYLFAACGASWALAPLWKHPSWVDTGISVLPNLLGFSVGAVAIILAAPSMKTFRILAEDGEADSYFMDLAARLVHFILVQVVALAAMFLVEAYPTKALSLLAFVLFAYALSSAVSAGLALFGIARILNSAAKFSDPG